MSETVTHTNAEPEPLAERPDYVVRGAEDQFVRFDRKARVNRASYFSVKVVQIVLAAAVPVAASANAPTPLTGSLGAIIVVLEGIQQLCQWHANWIRYRRTAELLRRELFMFRASVGDYATAQDPVTLLAERLDRAEAAEVAGWSTTFNAEGTSKT
jgi:hypothetical protein